jgi:hypothetical protein
MWNLTRETGAGPTDGEARHARAMTRASMKNASSKSMDCPVKSGK